MIEFIGPGYRRTVEDIGRYSDNTPFVKMEDFLDIANRCDTMLLKSTSFEDVVLAMGLADAVIGAGGLIDNLVYPYLLGARQDRSNITGDLVHTSYVLNEFISLRRFNKVLLLDPHSVKSKFGLSRAVDFPLEDVYARLYNGYGGVIAPDKGAETRADIAGKALGLPVTYGKKVRDVSTGRLSGFEVKVEAGKHYIVVDDICDGGGTFVGLGERIREQGAFADLYVTHGIFSKGTDELKKYYRNIYTTDSRQFHDRNDVYIIPIVERMIASV